MAGTMHLQTAGFLTSSRAPGSQSQARERRYVLIATWDTGYAEGLSKADEAKTRGFFPVLLKLARQDSPDAELGKSICARGFPLLSVSSKFAGKDWTSDDLAQAVEKAWRQSKEGLVGFTQHRPLSSAPRVTHPSTTTTLTDDERREYLRAIYRTTRDDGVR